MDCAIIGFVSHMSTMRSIMSATPEKPLSKNVGFADVIIEIRETSAEVQDLNNAWRTAYERQPQMRGFGWLLFVVGGLMMANGLFYEPTVPGEYGIGQTYNIGAISHRSTLTNTGGFLALCGAVFIVGSRPYEKMPPYSPIEDDLDS